MNTFLTHLRQSLAGRFLVALVAASILATSPALADGIQVASNDCYAIGMQQAAQQGGQLARATPETRNGQRVCVIVILLPARDGQRPRRSEIVVPGG